MGKKNIVWIKKVSLAYLFLLTIYSAAGAQPTPRDSLIYESILQARFSKAESMLESSRSLDAHYLRCLLAFIRTSLSGSETDYQAFTDLSDHALKILDKAEDSDLWARYYHQEILLQQAIMLIKFDHEISAAWRIRQTFKEAKRNLFGHDDFYPFHKTFGVLETLIGAVPENLQWIPGLFGMNGSIHSGLDHLNRATASPLLSTEARLIAALIQSYLLEAHDKAVDQFVTVWMNRTDSPLITYLGMNIMLRAHKASEAIEMYEKLSPTGKNDIAFLNYLAGIARLQLGHYAEAEDKLLTFIRIYRGEDYIRDGYYKLFLSQWLAGNKSRAADYYAGITDHGNDATEADRYATQQAGLPYPDPVIMKLRLYTDGGAYVDATDLVKAHADDEFKSPALKTEWVYRTGRLFHLQHETGRAMEQYIETIRLQNDENWYFAPNASLQLGYIYMDQENRELAEKYFNKVFDYRNYPYQKGIERSAQVALNTYF